MCADVWGVGARQRLRCTLVHELPGRCSRQWRNPRHAAIPSVPELSFQHPCKL